MNLTPLDLILQAGNDMFLYLSTVLPQIISIVSTISIAAWGMKRSIDNKIKEVKTELVSANTKLREELVNSMNDKERYIRKDLDRHERALEKASSRSGAFYTRKGYGDRNENHEMGNQ